MFLSESISVFIDATLVSSPVSRDVLVATFSVSVLICVFHVSALAILSSGSAPEVILLASKEGIWSALILLI